MGSTSFYHYIMKIEKSYNLDACRHNTQLKKALGFPKAIIKIVIKEVI